jgi:hypothetical protein
MKRHPTVILAIVTLLIAACGSADDGGDTVPTTESSTIPSTSMPPTTGDDGDPDRLILQVTDEGGFVPVEFLLTRMARHSLYADGTLLAPAAIAEIFPGPLVQPVQSIVLGDDDLRDVRILIDAIGLPGIDREIDDELTNTVADATTTVATYFDEDGGAHSYGVYALGLDTGVPMPDASANLGLLVELLDAFVAGGADAARYQPDRIQLWLQEGTIYDPEFVETQPWGLEITPEGFEVEPTFNRPCHVLDGDAAQTAIETFEAANQATVWDYEGTVYSLAARPLLPGETGCIP